MKKAVFGLEPLSCPSCIKKIENILQKTDRVREVNVLFHSNRIRTKFNEDLVKANELQDIIVKLGYPVLSQKVS